jgi:DNA-binding NtrC family response regulator
MAAENKTALIIEEAAGEGRVSSSVVSKMGLDSLLCNDGKEALILLKQRHASITLVLLDLTMTVIDGISILGHCKANYPELPVIVFIPGEDADDIAQAARWGANAFVGKPIESDKLESAISSVLGRVL